MYAPATLSTIGLQATTGFTISLWFMIDSSTDSYGRIFDFRTSAGAYLVLLRSATTSDLYWQAYSGSTTLATYYLTGKVNSAWHHFVINGYATGSSPMALRGLDRAYLG